MNILIANDDGYQAAGIHALAKALSEVADVYICAPDSQRSATGHGITMHRELYAERVDIEGAKFAYAISGTPADCVRFGLQLCKKNNVEIDIVFTGINMGGNLGTDVIYSGTVAGAIEGRIQGYPAVAMSVNGYPPTNFEYAGTIAKELALMVYANTDREKPILNVNVPDLPATDIKGLKSAHLGYMTYDERFVYAGEKDGKEVYVHESDHVVSEQPTSGSDVEFMREGYATITQLHYDLTSYDKLDDTAVTAALLTNKIIY